ncbi:MULTISPECIES: efflux RND transporter periplasmic adaptor subunit [Sinorhizobium]|uniref:Efflux transporter periplasmic adaptor subunit n=1 Tax=Sinorhizobium americanum TaxID=194963 RepID=A0A2S3YJU4_9HYPH|nr:MULTISPECIES: efflux RND transporter periplasmic adaptor subunit [Sinorhizobium]PDT41407.1 efflux transporter periplasmic adaptor subunit [Sinorhizobium sp. FG01]POH27615.1 efflux transporter periplasmic adaptor subunit [Sinorhizobium americanum]
MSSRVVIAAIALGSMLAGIAIAPLVTKVPGLALFDAADAHADGVAGRTGKAAHGASSQATAVQVTQVEQQDFPVVISTFANVQAPETVEVKARISSQIVGIHVKDGQTVRAGDLLFSLDDRALQADLSRDEAILAKDTALLADAAIELDRARTLRDDNTGTQQAYDSALSAQQSAKATVAADQAAVEADKVSIDLTRIRAPIGGRLGAVEVTIGDLVGNSTSGTSLVTITAIDPIEVAFHLPENHLQAFKNRLLSGAPPRVTARLSGTRGVIGTGVLDFIDSAVDTATGTVLMRAKFDNAEEKLWPGQYVDVDIDETTLSKTPVIPAVAVQAGQKGDFVYRLNADDTVELRPVVVAANNGQDAAIRSGLSAGDRVVTEGQLHLKAGDKARVVQ